MPDGIAWTKPEIDLLVRTVESGGCTEALAARLERTHEAVLSKARRLRLPPPQVAPRPRMTG